MTGMMRALRKTKPGPGLEMVEIPVPQVMPGEVLIKVRKRAICGTDLHIYKWDEWSAEPAQAPRDDRPRILRRDRRGGRRSPALQRGRTGDRRDAHRLQPVFPMPHRQRPSLRERGHTRASTATAASPTTCRARVKPLARPGGNRPRVRRHLRSLRQRRAHGHGRAPRWASRSSSWEAVRSAWPPSRCARRPAPRWWWSAR